LVKKIAYIVFDGITWLDFVGIYDPISRLKSMKYIPDLEWHICANASVVTDNFGLKVIPDKIFNDLSTYDAVIFPGGFGTRQLRYNEDFMNWIKPINAEALKISICTGSLLLGAAGFLKDKIATTNFNEYDTLAPYCKQVKKERIVEDGKVITAGAVASSLDLGLYLCEKWVDKAAAEAIKTKMAYQA